MKKALYSHKSPIFFGGRDERPFIIVPTKAPKRDFGMNRAVKSPRPPSKRYHLVEMERRFIPVDESFTSFSFAFPKTGAHKPISVSEC